MARHVFVALLFVVCAVYMACAAPNLKLEELKHWAEEQKQLDRVERGAGNRRGGGRGRGRSGGRGAGRGNGGGQGSRGGGRRGGGGRGRNRRPPPQHGGRGPPPPRGRWGQHGSSECDDDNNAAGQQGNNPTTTTTTTTRTTTTTTPTTTASTTTTEDTLVANPVPDADVMSGEPSGEIQGCVIATGAVLDPSKIKCEQVQMTSDFQLAFESYPHTQCGSFCQCSFDGVVVEHCPAGMAWDPTEKLCTIEAIANC